MLFPRKVVAFASLFLLLLDSSLAFPQPAKNPGIIKPETVTACKQECNTDDVDSDCVKECIYRKTKSQSRRLHLWHSDRRELSTSDTAALLKDECNTMPYDVAIYVDQHVYVAGIPSDLPSTCPLLVMEASDQAWSEETGYDHLESDVVPRGVQKHIHEVSLPANIDPKKFFDLLPLGTFQLSELLVAYDEAAATPKIGSDEVVFSSSDSPDNYDLVLANCGDFVAHMVTNLGVQFDHSMTNYIVRRLLDTYDGIAEKVRSNPNVLRLMEGPDGVKEDATHASNEELIRRLVERRVRHLYADEEAETNSQPSDGIPCGKWYSRDCIGDADIRYASDASDNLADQAALWSVLPGYYEADSYGLGTDGNKIPPTPVGEEDLLTPPTFPYSFDAFKMFLNITVDGSRYLEHTYQIFPPAPEAFCNETVPEGMANVALPGECGVNGISMGTDRYGTSSYERDGTLAMLPFVGDWFDSERTMESYVSTPVNEKTAFTSFSADGLLYQYAVACFDASCSGLSIVTETFDVTDPEKAVLIQTIRRTASRIETAQEFVDRINQVYEEFNVLPEQQYPAPMPLQDSCLSGLCPNDNVWCEYDPKCSISPYQEPAGSLKPGIYVLIVLVVLALNSLLFLYAAMRLMRKRENALKEKFAVRIAETIKVEGEERVLTADNIAEEFKQIDIDGSGMVNKAELFAFIQTGRAGKISESDFESLFAAIDLDKNGEIDFGEFVTFFQKCQHKYNKVKDQPTVRRNRASYVIPESTLEE